eukprot:Skav202783  [mRNA]  locus=scaffold326:487231:501497:+ [translate_table: standard]
MWQCPGRPGLFISNFNTGHWNLWNGNNWTPHLCIAVMAWLVSFWHEEPSTAREVLAMVNDILWLHRNMFTSDGVYVEGVAMYSFMSITGLVGISALQRASFGFAPHAVDANSLSSVVEYHLASMSTDGYTVAFGDSHKKRGWDTFSTLEAAVAAEIVGRPVESAALTPCGAREHAAAGWHMEASLYGSGGLYEDPWRISPQLLTLNLSQLAGARPARGPPGWRPATGLPPGWLRLAAPPAAGAPRGAAVLRQRRDGALPFDQAVAGGERALRVPGVAGQTQLLLPLGGEDGEDSKLVVSDSRRYQYIDNNPAGHNTVVVREAFKDGETINFSQLHWAVGQISTSDTMTDEIGPCLELDGSVPYGAERPDGWMQIMRRSACPLADGSFVLIDVLQVKKDRTAMNLYGALYGGPNFNEAEPPTQRLHLEEFFHTDTAADLAEDAQGNRLPEELPFERGSDPGKYKWCSHVDPVLQPGAASILLQAQCGLGDFRPADGFGMVSGFSTAGEAHPSGGRFVYDGLVTTVDRWFREHWLRKRRFRFVGDQAVGPEGDVRLFVLSPSLNATEAPKVGSCDADSMSTVLDDALVALLRNSSTEPSEAEEGALIAQLSRRFRVFAVQLDMNGYPITYSYVIGVDDLLLPTLDHKLNCHQRGVMGQICGPGALCDLVGGERRSPDESTRKVLALELRTLKDENYRIREEQLRLEKELKAQALWQKGRGGDSQRSQRDPRSGRQSIREGAPYRDGYTEADRSRFRSGGAPHLGPRGGREDEQLMYMKEVIRSLQAENSRLRKGNASVNSGTGGFSEDSVGRRVPVLRSAGFLGSESVGEITD